jgi:hypothetical protein
MATPPVSNDRILMTQVPPQLKVTVRGPHALIDDLTSDNVGPVQISLKAGTESRVTFEPNMVHLPAGVKLEQIDPPSIDLAWEDRILRDIPVQVSLVGSPAPGFVVRGVPKSDPALVRTRGPKSEVMVIQHVRTDAFDVTGLTDGSYTRQLAVDRPRGRVTIEQMAVSATIEVAREVAERPFPRLAVAVVGQPKGRSQPSEVDVRLVCPPEIVRLVRPEQLVPRAQTTLTGDHGSEAVDVRVSVDRCEVHVTPPTVVVRW